MSFDVGGDIIKVIKHQEVLESNYLYSGLIKKQGTPEIIVLSLFISMDVTVEFDREPFFNTKEIEYVISNAVLSPELSA